MCNLFNGCNKTNPPYIDKYFINIYWSPIRNSAPLMYSKQTLVSIYGRSDITFDEIPEVVVVVGVGKDDVERLEIQMNDSLTVDELNTPHHLMNECSHELMDIILSRWSWTVWYRDKWIACCEELNSPSHSIEWMHEWMHEYNQEDHERFEIEINESLAVKNWIPLPTR